MRKQTMMYTSDVINHGRIMVSTLPTMIIAGGLLVRKSVLVQNLSANDVYIGGSSVTTLSGVKLVPGASIEIHTQAAVYAIATVDASDVRYIEEA